MNFTSFIVGVVVAILIMVYITTSTEPITPDKTIAGVSLIRTRSDLAYHVTIDTTVTDSVFGKTWRK